VDHHEQHCADYLGIDELGSNDPNYPTIEELELVVVGQVDLA
jgi:hypothetical protein